ncbi:MAG: metallophosphoesterase [Candidatus Micrarchaeota archaeon]|nr:metallophosphoesterase [Candidatus Micrarchaeota archaeon]
MKILALSDLHAEEEILDRLKAISLTKRYDLVLFAGDLTNNGPVSYAREVVGLFPNAFAVHGNMDPPEVLQELERMGVSLHGRKVKVGEWNLVGLGGSNKTPFGTPSELSEEEIEGVLSKTGMDEFSIVVAHPPPYGAFDSVGSLNVGSKALRKFVEMKKPILLICGHIHEHEGKQMLGETLVVKLAPAAKLSAAQIEIKEEIKVSFIQL